MANFKKHNRTSDFTIMYNGISKNKSLSWKAKGLLLTLHSLPDDWEFSEKGLATLSKDGLDSTKAGLKELENNGYLIRERIRENGKLKGTVYNFYDEPQLQEKHDNINVSTKSGISNVGNINVGESHTIKNVMNKVTKDKEINNDIRLIDSKRHEENPVREIEVITRGGEQYDKEEFIKLENHYGKELIAKIIRRAKYKRAIKRDTIAYLRMCLENEDTKNKLNDIRYQSPLYMNRTEVINDIALDIF